MKKLKKVLRVVAALSISLIIVGVSYWTITTLNLVATFIHN